VVLKEEKEVTDLVIENLILTEGTSLATDFRRGFHLQVTVKETLQAEVGSLLDFGEVSEGTSIDLTNFSSSVLPSAVFQKSLTIKANDLFLAGDIKSVEGDSDTSRFSAFSKSVSVSGSIAAPKVLLYSASTATLTGKVMSTITN